jgi:uncharacterized protein (TIGR02271 family)
MDALERAVPGSSVRCTDGILGTLERISRDSGTGMLHVRGSNGSIAVPEGLVRTVRSDGTVELACGLEAASSFSARADSYQPASETFRLHEEELITEKEMREEGSVEVRTILEEFPGRIEIEAIREEVEIEHLSGGEEVETRQAPYEDGDYLYIPVYEEHLVVSKRLILKERIRVRRRARTEVRVFEDTLQRERVEITQPANTILARESYEVSNGKKNSPRE